METWIVAIVLAGMGCGTALLWRIIGLFGKRGVLTMHDSSRLERIEEQLALLVERQDEVGAGSRVAELEERLDFAERMLVRDRAPGMDERPVTPV
ncbi:MAG TPA: hypothetical protein VGA37_11365 [Gemmatimonadales bacterium]